MACIQSLEKLFLDPKQFLEKRQKKYFTETRIKMTFPHFQPFSYVPSWFAVWKTKLAIFSIIFITQFNSHFRPEPKHEPTVQMVQYSGSNNATTTTTLKSLHEASNHDNELLSSRSQRYAWKLTSRKSSNSKTTFFFSVPATVYIARKAVPVLAHYVQRYNI